MKNRDTHEDLRSFLHAVNRQWRNGWTEREIDMVCETVADRPPEVGGEVLELVRRNPAGVTMDEILNTAQNGSRQMVLVV